MASMSNSCWPITTKHSKLKGIIELCYETIAKPNSYGFRPMRSTKDAIEQIFNSMRTKNMDIAIPD